MSDLRAPLGNLKPLLKKLAKLQDMNLNRSRKYSGKGCSVSQPPKMRDEMPISTIYQKPRYEPTYSMYKWLE